MYVSEAGWLAAFLGYLLPTPPLDLDLQNATATLHRSHVVQFRYLGTIRILLLPLSLSRPQHTPFFRTPYLNIENGFLVVARRTSSRASRRSRHKQSVTFRSAPCC